MSLALAGFLGLGIGAGLKHSEVKETKAAGETTYYLDTTGLTGWENDNAKFYLYVYDSDGSTQKGYYQLSKVNTHLFSVAVNTTGADGCKMIRVNPSDTPSGSYADDSSLWGQGDWSSDLSKNYYCIRSWSSEYGSWETANPISVTLSVSFANAVPSYADIYLPSDFSGWAESDASKMTPSADRKTWTYSATNLARGSVTYSYKIIGCYAASGFDWNHQITPSDQSVSLLYSNDGKTVSLSSDNSYDFATNMPEQYAASGAVITLTFGSAISGTINVYYCGGLTGWANNASRLALALMAPNGSRTVFTYTIPENTPVGSYEFKIVAMSAHNGATAASYEYTVYDDNGGNASVTLDTTTTTYPYNATSTQGLDYLGALAFAQCFNSQMATPCSDQNANNSSAVSAIWTTLGNQYATLTSGARSEFASNTEDTIEQARTTYLHVVYVRQYVSGWTNGPTSANYNITITSPINSNNVAVIVIIVSSISLIALGGFLLTKKRKEN